MGDTPRDSAPDGRAPGGSDAGGSAPGGGDPARRSQSRSPYEDLYPGPEEFAGESLTAAEVAALEAEGGCPDDLRDCADPVAGEDPGAGAPPWWLGLPPAEMARAVGCHPDALGVPGPREPFGAGFTRGAGGPPGRGFAAGGELDRMQPGAELAWQVGQARQRGWGALGDDGLFGVMDACRRLRSWADGLELDLVAELGRRRESPDGSPGEHVAEELADGLGLTGRAAGRLDGLAQDLARLPGVLVLLTHGIIDKPRAEVLARHLGPLSGDYAAAVADVVLRRAAGLTTGQLDAACARAVLAADPDAARRRKEKALTDARVECWAEPAGTAALAGRDLPAADVLAADRRVDAIARWLRRHGTGGTLDNLRAKVFLALLKGEPLHDLLPAAPGSQAPGSTPAPGTPPRGGTPGAAPGGWPGGPGGTVHLTMPASAWLGLTDRPGEVAGFGAADADTCRDLAGKLAAGPAGAARWCVTITDEQGRAAAHGCARGGPGPPGTTDPRAWLAAVKISPIESGTCEHRRETASYQPPDSLRHIVKTRSPRCGFHGCRRPAVCCDDDHTLPWHKGGRTCECNLYPLCRKHHRCKQSPGWRLEQPEPGRLIWTPPSGRRHATEPEPYPV